MAEQGRGSPSLARTEQQELLVKIERTRKELLALARLCAEAIYEGPRLRGPDSDSHISKKTARDRARLLVKHCLDRPVGEHG